MPLIILLWRGFYFLYGGIINVEGGLGYDGYYYGMIAKNFNSMVFGKELNGYLIQRIFPSFVISSALTISGISKKIYLIIKAFQIYNVILLMLSSILWYKISNIFKINLKLIWLGFIFCFLNFGVAEMSLYYPVLTDTTALFLGFFLLYAYLNDNLILKIIITFIGAFTWANFIYLGMLLIMFPVNLKLDFKGSSEESLSIKKRWFIFLIPLPFFLKALYHINFFLNGGRLPFIETELFKSLLYISSVINYIFLTYFFFLYLPSDFYLKDYFIFLKKAILSIKPLNLLISVILFFSAFAIQNYLSNNEYQENSIRKMFYLSSLYGTTKPLVYIFLYVNYFGPAFIVFFFFLKYFKKQVIELGLGIYLFFIIALLIVLATEPRMNINFLPFFILTVILILRNFNISRTLFFLLSAGSFLFSKIYIPMFEMPDSNPDKNTVYNQILYMNYFTISKNSYLMLGIIVSAYSILVFYFLKKSEKVFLSDI